MPNLLGCFCFPTSVSRRPSSAKRSNLKVLKDIAAGVDSADEDTNKAIKSLLHNILRELSTCCPSVQESHALNLRAESFVNRHNIHELLLNLKFQSLHVSIQSLPVQRTETGLTTNVSSTSTTSMLQRPSCCSPSELSPASEAGTNFEQSIQHLIRRCTPSQLELLLQMESVVRWQEFVAACGLGQDAPHDMLGIPPQIRPNHCTLDQAGQVRIGSWNLNRFSFSKACHPGFREAICLTILRSHMSLVVLQEVANLDVANMICEELNTPTLPHVKQWFAAQVTCPPRMCWQAATSVQSTGLMFQGHEYVIFLYNSASAVNISRTGLLKPSSDSNTSTLPMNTFTRSPCSSFCRIRSSRFVIVSVHLKSRGRRNKSIGRTAAEVERIGTVVDAFNDTQSEGTHLIILGDFNLHPEHQSFNELRIRGMFNVLPGTQPTTVSTVNRLPSSHYQSSLDNAWLSSSLCNSSDPSLHMKCYFTRQSGVISHGLRHPLIPGSTGVGANGCVSDHCPIWFDIHIP